MLVTTHWPLKRAPHLNSLSWVCVVWRSKSSLELSAQWCYSIGEMRKCPNYNLRRTSISPRYDKGSNILATIHVCQWVQALHDFPRICCITTRFCALRFKQRISIWILHLAFNASGDVNVLILTYTSFHLPDGLMPCDIITSFFYFEFSNDFLLDLQ